MAAPPPIASLVKDQLLDGDGSVNFDKLLIGLNQFMTSTHDALSKQLTFAQNVAATVKDVRLLMPTEASTWTAVSTFANSWANLGGTHQPAQHRVLPGGDVELRMAIGSGTLVTKAFTLPAGYGPTYRRYFPACADAGAGTIAGGARVDANGDVLPLFGGNTFFGLEARWAPATPLPPAAFIGNGWPIQVKHGLSRCELVIPVACTMKDQQRNESIGSLTLDWADKGDGNILLRSAWGLQWGRVYNLRLLMLAG